MATTTLLPAALLANSNFASIANIDEGVASPDGVTSAFNVSGSFFRVSFPAPPGNLNSGAGLQTFRLRGRRTGGSNAVVVIDVYEAGSAVASAILTQSLASSLTDYSATWDASILTNSSGVDVQMHVRKTTNSDPSAIDAIDWIADYTPAAGFAPRRSRMGTRWMTSKRF